MKGRFYSIIITTFVVVTSLGPVSAAEVDLFRGTESEAVSTSPGAGVTVLRGTPPKAEAPAATTRASRPVTARLGARFQAGENLWYVDRRGRLHACWPQGTGYVGEWRIVCTGSR